MGGDSAQNPQFQPRQPRKSPAGDAFSHRRRRLRFPTGTTVEVQTNEKDFKGVCFSATVITPPNSPRKSGRKKLKKLYVEYHNLLAHEDGSDRLREYVGASFVRPPPPLLDAAEGFEPDDVVDAFYKDGWWTGVVNRRVDGGERYVVTFHNPPDELEFGISELRAHWDWVNGCWVRPPRQSIAGLMFDVGRKVEVSFDRDDFQDAWFPATVREEFRDGTFSVGCNPANADRDGVFNEVKVDSLHMRPCPPLLKDKNFFLLEKVDAFFDLGWWSGIITKQLENSRYLVYFRQMKCNKEFNQSELRLHMEWKDGKWFTSSQPQEPSIPFLDVPFLDDGDCQHLTLENTSASVKTAPLKNHSNDGEETSGGKPHPSLISRKGHSELLIPDNWKLVDVTIPLRKRRAYVSDSGSALSQPCENFKIGNLLGANKKVRHDGSEKEAASDFACPEPLSNMELSVAETTLDQSSSNHPWEEHVQRKQRNNRTAQNVGETISSIASSLRKSSAQVLALESLEIDAGEKDLDTAAGKTKVITPNGQEKSGLAVVIGLPCAETGSSGKRRRKLPYKKTFISVDDEKQVNDSTSQKIKDDNQSVTLEETAKKKRGRRKKNVVESTESLTTGNPESRDISSGDLKRKDDDSERVLELAFVGKEASISNQESTTAKRKVMMTKQLLASKHKKDNVEESVRPGVHSWKQRRRQISSGKISVKVRDLVDASGGELAVINTAVDVEKVVEPPSNKFDNEPLSKWIEEMHTSSAVDDSTVQCIMNGDNQSNGVMLGEANEKQPEIERQSLGLIDRGDIASTEPQSLPSVTSTVAAMFDAGIQTNSLVDKASSVASEPQSSLEKTVHTVLDEDNEKRTEKENGTSLDPASVDEAAVVPSEPENLPFVKNTFLWKTIESMEVFKKMPQKPHFQPLANLKESSREGVAIGYMVTFSSLVERASRLQINDSTSTMLDVKESLTELEKYGFNVKAVDDCINQLLAVKNTVEKLIHDISTIDNQITEHNQEKTRIEREVEEINEQITMLQKKLTIAESTKESKDEEIAFLLVRQRESKDSMKNVESDFNKIVSSIL